jgi:hypothetical protein
VKALPPLNEKGSGAKTKATGGAMAGV